MTAGIVEPLYERFARYRPPPGLVVCDQCGPEWSTDDIRSTPLRSLSLLQLEAIHVMSLDDDGFRHFFPRLIEALLSEKSPVFAFDLSRLRGRVPSWPEPEAQAVADLVDDLWPRLLGRYPGELGYFSDSPTLIDFTYWCDQPVPTALARWQATDTVTAAHHLADLVEWAFTGGEPIEPAVRQPVLDWLRRPVVGERLHAAKLATAHELWTVCAGGGLSCR
ncbi:hypothetical protein BayCH28_06775 [Mycolicibacterium sp. CH28]|uniref:hypothetical protein n=1 Tax=Mycolicibacterium sp. CH28 TaxID=2512237 RepID=UPI00108225D8|nr:hypothetical protein [Mycolicibacterium sp. CH28]TGD89071.1 hypothetical protein BayCH28_06775 [Mycolicibacterium sp. CH28]